MFDSNEAEHRDLRGGMPPWKQTRIHPPKAAMRQNFRCDVLVVGAGITGALCAEHFAASGFQTCVIDRQHPGRGSTMASTAMLLWEIDQRLGDLAELYGFERAKRIYRHSFAAAAGLVDLVQSKNLPCRLFSRYSIYLSTSRVGAAQLRAEHQARRRAGLPGEFIDQRKLAESFDLDREGAIVSPGSAEADPVLLVECILAEAIRQNVQLFDAEAVNYHDTSHSVTVEMDDGLVIEARHVVLATGYVMPGFVQSDLHQLVSTWAIATPPQAPNLLWRDRALIWEAADQYSYLRASQDNRIIIGGEDEETVVDPEKRDQLIPAKAEILLDKLKALWPGARAVTADFKWSGAFGTTVDGLPLIGRVPGRPRILAAYGYGGNGITYSYLASRMISAMIAGKDQDWFDDFAIDRNM